ncbi:DUF6703 family protein [Nocardiopsis suaedae]|uniref:Sensor histidine kinase n=1 Tax=Nocardiopsis suaedae TaxID=3018444 RepID=A0ABT4TE64_9ACTN|nr:DUF6703 family protein [Nocardiopsis suaedae]MDA2802993.1 hypothetical protein [Nocardiopsis suaedae]
MAAKRDDGFRRAGRPLPTGDSFFTPGAGPLRRRVEQVSAVPLVWLHQAPRWILPVAMAAVFITGLLLPGPLGGALLVALAAFIGWLAFLAWPNLRSGERLMRVVVVAGLAAMGVIQAVA